MTNTAALRNRLEHVNTQLNAIEEGWPWRPPARKTPLLEIDLQAGLPQYAIDAARREAAYLQKSVTLGWELSLHVFTWGGAQCGAMAELFVNGDSFKSVRYFAGDEPHLLTKADCLRACISLLPTLVDSSIERLAQYPLKTFKSKRYAALCKLRRDLNQQWQKMVDAVPAEDRYNVPGQYAYPYGKHKDG